MKGSRARPGHHNEASPPAMLAAICTTTLRKEADRPRRIEVAA